ncbi:NUDIX hydrolase [Pseudohalocynthiibacter aestuariivivens]|nr:NUDIX hydrolase [Pseudohalocynthiibacter aestuariivivens]QIE47448.1 NUDIX hydrolase [Pseudohalocynthiibacter aestuariivivens]
MTVLGAKQVPIALLDANKSDVRTQFAALCYRMVKDKPQILLITSRRTGRWIIPKGWPMDGETPANIALTEAWEEAGVRGKVNERCLGLYSYHKSLGAERGMPCVAMVYAVRVKSLVAKYPEAGQRKRKWLRPKKAAALVNEPELAHIIANFHPRQIKR